MKHGVMYMMDSSHFNNKTFSVSTGGKNWTTKLSEWVVSKCPMPSSAEIEAHAMFIYSDLYGPARFLEKAHPIRTARVTEPRLGYQAKGNHVQMQH